MMDLAKKSASGLRRWEWWVLILAVALSLVLAVMGRGRKERRAYEDFERRAAMIQENLERFAAQHDGAFPADSARASKPRGMPKDFMDWDPDWKIDYEVHHNGQGSHYVCLEYLGPQNNPQYYGLCNNPEYRRDYGRGQPVPGSANRIWLIREQAKILALLPGQGQ